VYSFYKSFSYETTCERARTTWRAATCHRWSADHSLRKNVLEGRVSVGMIVFFGLNVCGIAFRDKKRICIWVTVMSTWKYNTHCIFLRSDDSRSLQLHTSYRKAALFILKLLVMVVTYVFSHAVIIYSWPDLYKFLLKYLCFCSLLNVFWRKEKYKYFCVIFRAGFIYDSCSITNAFMLLVVVCRIEVLTADPVDVFFSCRSLTWFILLHMLGFLACGVSTVTIMQ
jgi:hypothetical protein